MSDNNRIAAEVVPEPSEEKDASLMKIMTDPYNKEKLLLDRLGKWTRQHGYTLTPHESTCIQQYNSQGYRYALANAIGWSTIAYYTFKQPRPGVKALKTWVKLYGLVAMSVGGFISAIGCSKMAAGSCLGCFGENEEMTEFRRKMEEFKVDGK